MTTTTSPSPPVLAAVLRTLKDKYSLVIWFLVINVFIGSAGIWAPLIFEIRHGNEAVHTKFLEVLRSASGYTFLLAYLAAASSYVILEYIDRSDESFRKLKAVLLAIAVVIGFLAAIFATDLISRPISSKGQSAFTLIDDIQVWMTIVAIVIGFVLALLQWAGAYSFDAYLDDSQQDQMSRARTMMASAQSAGGKKGQRVIQAKNRKVKV